MAKNRDVLFLSLRYDIYDSPTPGTFLRSASPITEDSRKSALLYPRDIKDYRAEDCHSVTLTSEIGRGATGVVHRGMLDVESSRGFMTLDVVVKLAFDGEQRAALKNEYEIYRLLRSKRIVNGIVKVLGLFDDFEGGPSALVMLDAISKMCLCSRDPGELGVAGSSRSKNHAPGVRTMLQELGLGAAGRTRSTGSTRSPGSAYLVNIKELFFVIKNCPK